MAERKVNRREGGGRPTTRVELMSALVFAQKAPLEVTSSASASSPH